MKIRTRNIQGIVRWGYRDLSHCHYHGLSIHPKSINETKKLLRDWLPMVQSAEATVDRPSETIQLAFSYQGIRKLLASKHSPEFSEPFTRGMNSYGSRYEKSPTWDDQSIDVLAIVLAKDEALIENLDQKVSEWPGSVLTTKAHPLPSSGTLKEHFGFDDGISQPGIPEFHKNVAKHNELPAGELVLGYPNIYGKEIAGFDNFGRDGSYLVFQQIEQNVTDFWKQMISRSERLPNTTPIELASRILGRRPDGQPLETKEHFSKDPHGFKCPLGAHIRRANPRISKPGNTIENANRILRRGRIYGTPLVPSLEPEALIDAVQQAATSKKKFEKHTSRGLCFIGLVSDIERQFETIYHSWIQNVEFSGLQNDIDGFAGTNGHVFTLPKQGGGTHITLQASVHYQGGGYFFLPSIQDLKVLSN